MKFFFVVNKPPDIIDCQSKIQQIESGTTTGYEIVNCDSPAPTGPVSLYSNLMANNIKVIIEQNYQITILYVIICMGKEITQMKCMH